tara:strand:+ start:40332 stop:44720 length:4389 start_codon:yes stop_codon:yes gene_type:complete
MMRKQEEERRRREEEEALLIGMTPEEEAAERSTLEHAADLPLNALGLVGGVLDTPGSWVRNLLSGRNPFRGTFDFDRRTTGEEMLEAWGAGEDPGFAAGFTAEVLLDPLTYVGPGILSKIMKGAGLAGKGLRGVTKTAARKSKHLSKLAEAAEAAGKRADHLDTLSDTDRYLTELGDQARGLNDVDGSSGLFKKRQSMDVVTPKDMVTFADEPAEAAERLFRAAEGRGIEVGSDDFMKMMNEPIGAYHMGVPFSGAGLKVPFTSMKPRHLPRMEARLPGGAALSPLMDALGHGIAYSGPVRFLSEKFSPSAGGFGTELFQREAGPALQDAGEEAERRANEFFTRAAQEIGSTRAMDMANVAETTARGKAFLQNLPRLQQSALAVLDPSVQRHILELGEEGADILGNISRLDPADLRKIRNVRDLGMAEVDAIHRRAEQLGAKAHLLDESPLLHRVPQNTGAGPRVSPTAVDPNVGIFGEQGYWPRYGTGLQRGRAAETGGAILDVEDPSAVFGRRAELKGVSGGEATIQAILRDPEVDALRKAIRRIKAPGISRFIPSNPFYGAGRMTTKTNLQNYQRQLKDLIYKKYGVTTDASPVTKTRTRFRLPGAEAGRQTITTTNVGSVLPARVPAVGGGIAGIPRKSQRGFFHNSAEAMGRAADEGEDVFATVRDQTDAFSHWVENITDEQVKKGVFGNAPIVDMKKRVLAGIDSNSAKEVSMGMVGRHAKSDLPLSSEFLTAEKALKKIGVDLGEADADNFVREFMGEATAKQIRQTLTDAGQEASSRNIVDYFAKNFRVDGSFAEELGRVKNAYTTGKGMESVLNFVDGYMNMFKANVTGPHAMYQSRNLVSGQIENAVAGMWSKRSTGLVLGIIRGGKATGVETIPVVKAELKRRGMDINSENGLRVFEEIVERHGVPPDMHVMRDVVGQADSGRAVDRLDPSRGLFGSRKFNVLENVPLVGGRWYGVEGPTLLHAVGRKLGNWRSRFFRDDGTVPAFNPLGTTHVAGASPLRKLTPEELADRNFQRSRYPGAGGPVRGPRGTLSKLGAKIRDAIPGFREATSESTWSPVVAGQELADFTETLNRVSPFAELLWRGVDPAEAARIVKGVQVDYSNRAFTRFETDVMQRIFPFYKFTRKKGEWVAKTLAEQPGGRLGQAIRGARLNRVEGYVPEHVAETASIPLGGPFAPEEAGPGERQTHRYLTSLGFMFEDPIQMLSSSPSEMGRELLSRANPLLKYPLEEITGQTFFQKGPQGVGGRPLSDLTPILPGILANLGGIPTGDQPIGGPGGLTGREVRKKLAETYRTAGFDDAEHLLMNTPLARWVSELRQATSNIPPALEGDTSRLLSYLTRTATGMRPTDIEGWQREMVRRQNLEQAMRGLGGVEEFQKLYYPKAAFAGMPEEEAAEKLALQDLHASLSKAARARSKARLGDLAKRQEREKELQELLEYLRASRSYQLQGLE